MRWSGWIQQLVMDEEESRWSSKGSRAGDERWLEWITGAAKLIIHMKPQLLLVPLALSMMMTLVVIPFFALSPPPPPRRFIQNPDYITTSSSSTNCCRVCVCVCKIRWVGTWFYMGWWDSVLLVGRDIFFKRLTFVPVLTGFLEILEYSLKILTGLWWLHPVLYVNVKILLIFFEILKDSRGIPQRFQLTLEVFSKIPQECSKDSKGFLKDSTGFFKYSKGFLKDSLEIPSKDSKWIQAEQREERKRGMHNGEEDKEFEKSALWQMDSPPRGRYI